MNTPLAVWESKFKLQYCILAKLRFRDHQLRTQHISKTAVKIPVIHSFSWMTEVIKRGNTAGFFFSCWLQFVVISSLFSWQRMVSVSIKLVLRRSVQGQVIWQAGMGFFPVPPDVPQSSSAPQIHNAVQYWRGGGSKRFILQLVSCGCVFGIYKSWVKFCIQFAEASCSFPNQWRPMLSFTRETKELIV